MEKIEECIHEECEDGYCHKQMLSNQPCTKRQKTIPELQKLRMGLTQPAEFIHSEALRRSHSLRLSSSRTIELSHHSSVNTLDIDPAEHRYLLSGAKNGRIIIHDLQTSCGKRPYVAKVIQKIDRENPSAHKYSVERVQWYPHDSGMFVTSGMDKRVKVWDSNMMTTALDVKMKEKIYNHEMSKLPCVNCLIAVASAEKKVTILDLKSGSAAHELVGHTSGVLTCCWSPREGALLATGSRDNRILLWDIRSAKSCLKSLDQHNGGGNSISELSVSAHDGFVNGLHFTRDGFSLVSFGSDNRIRVWDIINGKNKRINFGTVVNDCQKNIQITLTNLDSGSDMVFVPSRSQVLGFKVATGVRVSTLAGHYYTVNCCIFEPWFHELYSGGKDHYILLWSSDNYLTDLDDRPGTSYSLDNSGWSDSD
ncbi:hypothetical protein J437_LFUL006986 [Ladona fulva]|uniref:Uncharacterized protein n=1 Tax=Ladona fulva TaxID=123851 RepID=A0A8K0NX30_LADFU|nr:hypothetical protein J437_LFUL006986 [Ladona fulva]